MVAVPADISAHDMYGPESAQKRGTAPAFVRWVLPAGASTYDWAGEGGSTAIWPLVGPKKLVCRVRLHKYYVFPLRHVRHMAVRPLGHPPMQVTDDAACEREERKLRASAPENAELASPPSCPGEDFYHHARDRPQRHWKKPPLGPASISPRSTDCIFYLSQGHCKS